MTTRYIVFGAGAIGGTVGALLAEAGHDVALVARGEHARAIHTQGLRLDTPDRTGTYRLPVTDDVTTLDLGPDDVVLLAVKSQGTQRALEALAGPGVPVALVCLQNGVANEDLALRFFADVYAVPVICPTLHLEPGVVVASAAPITGILDIGRYPAGVDDRSEQIADAFTTATFVSASRPDIMRWKWRKLVSNLANAVEALCGIERGGGLARRATDEGEAVLVAAGTAVVTSSEDAERRGDILQIRPVHGADRPGGSTWQSLARNGDMETDYLNGEIARLGRLHGVPTPVNEMLQREVRRAALRGEAPGSRREADLLALVD